jgi:dipeptidyl aminopeptidase/acylaminoacyl peptidase
VPSDPMLHLDDGVRPAVEHLISLGMCDSARLGLIGHSYGGYTVYGLLTQTTRYKAAVALAGLTDLTAWYFDFDPRLRYSEPAEAAAVGPLSLERAQGRMGVPPWVDPERYQRNSPVFGANRITTPLLIVQGDLDFEGAQNEELFTALDRLGRRAEFVRYLGEGHIIDSPANVIDLWNRIFDWFDSNLMPLNRPGH